MVIKFNVSTLTQKQMKTFKQNENILGCKIKKLCKLQNNKDCNYNKHPNYQQSPVHFKNNIGKHAQLIFLMSTGDQMKYCLANNYSLWHCSKYAIDNITVCHF